MYLKRTSTLQTDNRDNRIVSWNDSKSYANFEYYHRWFGLVLNFTNGIQVVFVIFGTIRLLQMIKEGYISD